MNLAAFEVEEKLTFDIKYGIITAGQAELQIEEFAYKDTIPSFKITSIAKTNNFFDNFYKVRDKIESIWSKESLETLRFTKKLSEGSYRQHRIHFYYPEQNITIYMKYKKKINNFKEEKIKIPPNTQDILSAFYYLRLKELSVGDTITINVTADGRNYPADIIVLKKEILNTILGEKECFVVEPIIEGEAIFKQTGKIKIWLTADEYKIPVRMSSKIIFGHFKAILKDAEKILNTKE